MIIDDLSIRRFRREWDAANVGPLEAGYINCGHQFGEEVAAPEPAMQVCDGNCDSCPHWGEKPEMEGKVHE